MYDDIGNTFIRLNTKAKIYIRCGSEFGKREKSVAITVCTLYSLTTSTERVRTMLLDSLHNLVFVPSCFDRDVWIRQWDPKDRFDFIYTHVNDFKVIAQDPDIWIEHITSVFLIKEHGPRKYYLGNDCKDHGDQDMWIYGISTYAKNDLVT